MPEQIPENEGRIELTLEEKYRLVGKKDSILDKRGVHLSVGYLDELLKEGIHVDNKDDFDAIADAIVAKHLELTEHNLEAAQSSEEIKARHRAVEVFIQKYGFDSHHSQDLMDEWIQYSKKWVAAEGTPRAQIIHNLRVMDLLRAGGRMNDAVEVAEDVYDAALAEGYEDIVDDILKEFPEFGIEE